MPSRNIRRGATLLGEARPENAPIYVDSDDDIVKLIPAGSGTTEVQLIDATHTQTITGDKTFTGTCTFTSEVTTSEWFANGTVSLPSISFASEHDCGFYYIGANNIGMAMNAAKVLDVSTTGLGVVGTILNGNGTVSLPSYSFTGDPNTGMYWISADTFGFAVNGVETGRFLTGAFVVSGIANGHAYIALDADAGADSGDTWILRSADSTNLLEFDNETTNVMSLNKTGALVLAKASTAGLRIANWVGSGAAGSAVPFIASNAIYADGQVDIAQVYGESTTDLTSAYSAKCGRFRHLVSTTAGTIAHETYGVVGQVVTMNTTSTHLHAGVMGTFEGNTTGSTLSSSYGVGHAAVIARIGGHNKITATTPLAGFLAFNNASAALTGASSISTAFAASMASATYPWSVGLYLPRGSVNQGIRIGHWAGTASLGNAIVFDTATDSADASQLDIVACYGESATNLTSAISAKVGRFRHLVNGITCAHEAYGLVGQVVAKNVTYSHLHAGLMGTFEVNTAATVSAGDAVGCAGVIARVGGATITVGSTGVLSGFLSAQLATTVSITSGGVHAAFACRKVGAGITWAEALHVEDALVVVRCKAADNSYAHGVKATNSTIATSTSHVFKFMVGTTAVYVPGYALETLAGA